MPRRLARPFVSFADVETTAANPDCAAGYLCTYGKKEVFGPCSKAGAGHYGGNESMLGLRNTAPETPYRKYNHFLVEDGTVSPALIVCGTPSVSLWSNWTYEDFDAACRQWQEIYAAKTAKDNSAAITDEKTFDRMLASDCAHTAEIRAVDGVSRLFVDGEAALPLLYLGKDPFGDDAALGDPSAATNSRGRA